ncbi:MAG: helix-turn-helix domain-containing protein [Lactococcus cremoris]|uniref:helix-turn-helix domain-containing protein n=1 Tax=Lactococcus TaxID=1357 RepID=UPI000C797BD2|nr:MULTISPECIES: helix-turn-helix domain-containing protein [Lactococcus]MCT0045300.1 helix-turn-helix domain-containing protein [Lactococcus lactis subsp. lactis]MCT4416446.1 helix-turn-helix domain-containing protein [Lactococcus cremoris]MCT4418580.1 helix-turn-helix domain-containing protein [Lactococcus cremoris]
MGRGTLTPQEEELKKVISNNIRTKIKEEGISQAEFARRAGIPPTTLSGYIKGVTRPNAGNLQKISDTLGLLKSDIDPSYKQGYSLEDWNNNKKQSHLVKKITEISSQLEEPRQKIVLDTASSQLEEQEEQKSKIVSIKNEQEKFDLADLVDDSKVDWDKWVSFDGRPLTDDVKEAMKRLLGKRLEDK